MASSTSNQNSALMINCSFICKKKNCSASGKKTGVCRIPGFAHWRQQNQGVSLTHPRVPHTYTCPHTKPVWFVYKVEGILLLLQNYILAGVKNLLGENTPHTLIVHLLGFFTGAFFFHASKDGGFLRGSLPSRKPMSSVPASTIQS